MPSAAPVGNLVGFGDSLSDTGNVSLATAGAIPNPSLYHQGRFSNGPVWVDTLAKYLGEPAVQPSLAGGLDYAFGGATVAATAVPPFNAVPTLAQQVGQYLTGQGLPTHTPHTPAANDLFAVWAGANDFIDTFSSPQGPVNPIASADALESSLKTLANAGARQFVVNNLPPLGETPFIRGLKIPGLSAAADAWSAAFNNELKTDLASLKAYKPGTTVVQVDVAGLFHKVIAPGNPFGFVNTTDAVGPLAPGSVFLTAVTAADPQHYLFFDGVHPTSKGQQLIGLEAAAGVFGALGVHDLVVTSTADTVDPTAGGLSLRETLNLSNAMGGGEKIRFNLGAGPHEIKLDGHDLDITAGVTIQGPGAGSLTLSGQGLSRVFEVASGVRAGISGLTFRHGSADKGGAVYNAGDLTLSDTAFYGNQAQQGGAIFNAGTLHVDNGSFDFNAPALANSATGVDAGERPANSGAGARAYVSHTFLVDNVVSGGSLALGGGVANLNGAFLSVTDSFVAGNGVRGGDGGDGLGGGIYNGAGSALVLRDNFIVGNYAQAGNGGHGFGGGLYLSKSGTASLTRGTTLGNYASTGGQDVYAVPKK